MQVPFMTAFQQVKSLRAPGPLAKITGKELKAIDFNVWARFN
jgi:hypothetical protein